MAGAPLAYRVLGPLEVCRDGRLVPLPGRRCATALAVLLVHVNRVVDVDTVAEVVWAGGMPLSPRASLHTVISRLRHVLGGASIVSVPAGYRLAVDEGACDASLFEEVAARAAALPSSRVRDLDEALALWRGPAYAGFDDVLFTAESDRLERLRVNVLDARATRHLEACEPQSAAELLEPVVASNPLREHSVELLVCALHEAGRPDDALARFRGFRDRLADELGLDPSPAMRDLQTRILNREPARSPGREPGPVVSWFDTSLPFVAREQESADLLDLSSVARIVTVTGPGGVGKSRLVAELLPAIARRSPGSVAVALLAPVHPGGVDAAVARALGVATPEGDVRAALMEYLAASTVLLVLDNCEQVLGEAADLVSAVTRQCPQVRVLATSRHRLGMLGERALALTPLSLPDPDSEPGRAGLSGSVRLFQDRVRQVRPGFAVTRENRATIAEICRRLDGLPLALELGAARGAELGVDVLLDLLGQAAHTPSSRSFDAARAHAGALMGDGLDAVVDWSYRLLTGDAQDLLRLVSVFPGEFDVAAATGLFTRFATVRRGGRSADEGKVSARPGVAAALAELVEASLLMRTEVDGETRFTLLVTVQSFAADRLVRAGEDQHAREAHAMWIGRVVEQVAVEARGPRCGDALARLALARADIGAAMRWALDAARLDLASAIAGQIALCTYWTPDLVLGDLIISTARGQRQALESGSEPAVDPVIEQGPAPEVPAPDDADEVDAGDEPTRCALLAVAAGGFVLAARGEFSLARDLLTFALARSPREQYLATLGLAVAAIYEGSPASTRLWEQIATMPGASPGQTAAGHTSLSLEASFRRDAPAARRHAELALLATETVGAAAEHAFAVYAAGEAELVENPRRALDKLAQAAEEAQSAGAVHVRTVARLARLSALVRLGLFDEALDAAGPLLEHERRVGVWPQLWTTMRIVAELLAGLDRPREGWLLLAASQSAVRAPQLRGDDVARYGDLEADLRHRLGDDVTDGIAVLAAGLTRLQVLDRALAFVDTNKES